MARSSTTFSKDYQPKRNRRFTISAREITEILDEEVPESKKGKNEFIRKLLGIAYHEMEEPQYLPLVKFVAERIMPAIKAQDYDPFEYDKSLNTRERIEHFIEQASMGNISKETLSALVSAENAVLSVQERTAFVDEINRWRKAAGKDPIPGTSFKSE